MGNATDEYQAFSFCGNCNLRTVERDFVCCYWTLDRMISVEMDCSEPIIAHLMRIHFIGKSAASALLFASNWNDTSRRNFTDDLRALLLRAIRLHLFKNVIIKKFKYWIVLYFYFVQFINKYNNILNAKLGICISYNTTTLSVIEFAFSVLD